VSDWVKFEDAHVAELRDTTKRAPAGQRLIQVMIDSEPVAVLGEQTETVTGNVAVKGSLSSIRSMISQTRLKKSLFSTGFVADLWYWGTFRNQSSGCVMR
jgi:hypothetical protein